MSLFDQVQVPKLSSEDEDSLDNPESDNPEEPHTIKQFCQSVLHSRQYRLSLRRRVEADALSPQIETLLYHYAYGKPADRFEHTGKDGNPIETVTEVRRVIIRGEVALGEDSDGAEAPYTRH